MEAIATSVRIKSSSGSAKIDWPFLTFWLTYFAMVFGIGYIVI
jgi:hypothetical protein